MVKNQTKNLNSYIIKKSLLTEDCFVLVILAFPITTLFQSINLFSLINKFFFGVSFLLLFTLIFRDKHKNSGSGLFFLTLLILTHILAVMKTDFPLVNVNLLFYFFYWSIYFWFFINHLEMMKKTFFRNSYWVEFSICVWTFLVLLSAAFPSSYVSSSDALDNSWGEATYFVSFTGNPFRLAPCALMIITLVILLYSFKKISKTKAFIYSLIPLFVFFTCGSRIYLGVGIIEFVILLYLMLKNKRKFFLYLIPFFVIFCFFLGFSPVWEKIKNTFNFENSYFDFWGTITNSRSVFWEIDLYHFSCEKIFNQLFGCGFNYVYEINAKYYGSSHWAHNDFIQILLTFGYLGFFLYLWPFISLFLFKKEVCKNSSTVLVFLIFCVWLLNAFFNMFYVYLCSFLSFPILIISIMGSKKKELNYYEFSTF